MGKRDSTATSAPEGVANPLSGADVPASGNAAKASNPPPRPREIGGPTGLEPTRYGDWERNGRVSDF
jgi:hypothetical protein